MQRAPQSKHHSWKDDIHTVVTSVQFIAQVYIRNPNVKVPKNVASDNPACNFKGLAELTHRTQHLDMIGWSL